MKEILNICRIYIIGILSKIKFYSWGDVKDMNQNNISMCEKWLKIIGKRKIQSFQDSYADLFNISLGIIDLNGESLTVWSNSSLFCHYIIKNNKERCKQEKKRIIDHVIKKQETIKYICYMNVIYFACPIFFNNDLVALCLGGGVQLEENKNDNYKIQNIPVFSEDKLNDIIRLLENVLSLITINKDVNLKDKNTKIGEKQEIVFLEKKLTLREIQIVKLINDGLTNKEISLELNISEKTVKTHITNILRKLHMKDRLEIVIFCRKNIMN